MNFNPYYSMQQNSNSVYNGGLVSVRNVNEARNYPVAPGNSVTFKDENSPYIYTKTMGFSQLDRPMFEVFRLVREDYDQEMSQKLDSEYDYKKEIEALKKEVSRLKEMIEGENDHEYSANDSDNTAVF
ncbi:MAG TPA: hypothetical protein DHV37_05845 [Erysipelotrichaceae bacterium]|jgi:hypothetical protein|nr:hypothetical protein [Erysipelotrichaceae bacterium]